MSLSTLEKRFGGLHRPPFFVANILFYKIFYYTTVDIEQNHFVYISVREVIARWRLSRTQAADAMKRLKEW